MVSTYNNNQKLIGIQVPNYFIQETPLKKQAALFCSLKLYQVF